MLTSKERAHSPVDAPKVIPSEDALHTLHTLKSRLEAQVDGSAVNDDPATRSILISARRRLNQVNMALASIEEGKYGICADCDKTIQNDRLVLQPFVTRCTTCQNIAEWRGLDY